MTLLIVTPDYASHWYPLSAVAGAAQRRGIRVVVATGPTLRTRVESDGFEWMLLRMSATSNAGIAGRGELADFFTATRRGMVATLCQQAETRLHDLLWRPDLVAGDVLEIVGRVAPDAVVVDHLAFAATLALRAAGVPFTTFVPGHPSQVPAAGERYGFPTAWPNVFSPDPGGLAELWSRCDDVATSFTDGYNDALRVLDPTADPVDDAFAAHGEDVLYNSPAALHPPDRALPCRHAFLGSCVRSERPDSRAAAWVEAIGGDPFVYVSFGTFLSARDDVLARVAAALRSLDVAVALSTGSAASGALGPLPPSWLVAPTLPQVELLQHASCIVGHGGNNSVTEALAAGSPIVAMPFSTDQFAIAADLERTGHGTALDPNVASVEDIAGAVSWCDGEDVRSGARSLAAQLHDPPGPELAVDRILAGAR